ncbi:hypothetical protein BC629DRAFT_1505798 [Irpex lacteus]|nr:hypothetical protein BC629DRAFT_1505798 [Irpex lacteus]
MSQTTRSAISTLPNELLLHIFRHVSVITPRFPWNKSPLLLSLVCILWRNLILATSSLWSDIDLHHLSMAKHRLALARDQPLDIIWFRSDDNSTSLEQYDAGAVDLFNRVGKELSQLRELIASAGFRHMNPLQLAHMPNLRVLSISDYMLDGANLMEVLRNSVMLMKLKLVSTTRLYHCCY